MLWDIQQTAHWEKHPDFSLILAVLWPNLSVSFGGFIGRVSAHKNKF